MVCVLLDRLPENGPVRKDREGGGPPLPCEVPIPTSPYSICSHGLLAPNAWPPPFWQCSSVGGGWGSRFSCTGTVHKVGGLGGAPLVQGHPPPPSPRQLVAKGTGLLETPKPMIPYPLLG